MSPIESAAPLTRVSLADQVRDRLREAVIFGEFPQGSSLTEPAIATRYSVSRAPVREALLALEREGLVAFDARGRAQVIDLTPDVFEELVAVRVALEGTAARLAATRSGPELAVRLEEKVARQDQADSYRELTRLDVAFHETIVRAAGNARLLAAWLTVRSVFEFWLAATFRDTELAVAPRAMAAASHRRLLKAVTSGDAERAEKAAVAHVTRWRSYLPNTRPAPEADE